MLTLIKPVMELSLKKICYESLEWKELLTTMHGTQEIETKAVDGLSLSTERR